MNPTVPLCLDPQRSAENAFLDAFNALREDLYSNLFYLLNNHADAQDALQVAFLHCWRARAKLPSIGNLRAWIWRVALNAGRDLRDRAWRRRARSLSAIEGTACCRQRRPAEDLIDREERERLRAALIRLRPEEKEVFLLRQNGELTFEEIARLRGRPVASGKTLMRSALRKLRQIVREEEDAPSDQPWSRSRLRRSSSLAGALQ